MASLGDGSATIDGEAIASKSVPSGTQVTFAATPDEGCEFVRWYGDTADLTPEQRAQPVLELTVDRTLSLKPTFRKAGTYTYPVPYPSDQYTRVEFIHSSKAGKGPVIVTDYVHKWNTRITCTALIAASEIKAYSWQAVFGARNGWGGTGNRLVFNTRDGGTGAYYYRGTTSASKAGMAFDQKTVIDCNGATASWIGESGTVDSETIANVDLDNGVCKLAIFGLNQSGNSNSANIDESSQAMRLYGFSIYEDGVLVHRFIPCQRKSDNALGLYDTEGQKFFANYQTSWGDFDCTGAKEVANVGDVTLDETVSFDVSTTVQEGGSATINGEATSEVALPCGASVTFAATPDEGYEFVRWYGDTADLTPAQRAQPVLELTLDRDRRLVPAFRKVGSYTYKVPYPSNEYTRVEFIHSPASGGHGPVIVTDYVPKWNTRIECTAHFDSTEIATTSWGTAFGCRNGTYGSANALGFSVRDSGKTCACYSRSGESKSSTGMAIDQKTVISCQGATAAWAGENLVFGSVTTSTEPGDGVNRMILFGNNRGGVDGLNYDEACLAMRLYGFSIYEDGVLVHRFIPCQRKSDNALGLYDTEAQKFFANTIPSWGSFDCAGAKEVANVGDVTLDETVCFDVSTTAATGGSVTIDGESVGVKSVPCGFETTVEATSAEGYEFVRWYGIADLAPAERTNAVLRLTIDRSRTLTPAFRKAGTYTYPVPYPSNEYTRVEFIHSSKAGKGPVIVTDYLHKWNTRITCTARIAASEISAYNWQAVFGARNGWGGTSNRLVFNTRDGGTGAYYYRGTTSAYKAGMAFDQKTVIDCNGATASWADESGTVDSETIANVDLDNGVCKLAIFGLNQSGNSNSANIDESSQAMRLYGFSIYEDNVLVHRFIPCRRNSDDALGLYDTEAQKFFGNTRSDWGDFDCTGAKAVANVGDVTLDETVCLDLSFASVGHGSVSVDGAPSGAMRCAWGTVLTAVATPEEGYAFVSWGGDVGGLTAEEKASPTLRLTVDRPRALKAGFRPAGGAAVHHVPGDYPTVAEALASELVFEGDTIAVAEGRHTFAPVTDAATSYPIIAAIRKDVAVIGAGMSNTVLDCSGAGGFILDSPGAKLGNLSLYNFLRTKTAPVLDLVQGVVSNVFFDGSAGSIYNTDLPLIRVRSGTLLTDCDISRISDWNWWQSNTLLVEGGTVRRTWIHGISSYWGHVRVQSSNGRRPLLEDCLIEGNHGRDISMANATDADFAGCTFRGNRDDDGGAGLWLNGRCTLVRCAITGNTSNRKNPLILSAANATACFTNCLIAANTVNKRGVFRIGGGNARYDLCNVTIARNRMTLKDDPDEENPPCGFSGDGTEGAPAAVHMVNSIVWDNRTKDVVADFGTYAHAAFDIGYSCFTGFKPAAGDHNLDADPKLKGSCLLRGRSPCIDAGATLGWTEADRDLLGNPRLLLDEDGNGSVDMGCYECPRVFKGMMLLVR